MTRASKRVFVGVVALVALGLGAAPASAHATLETTTPSSGAQLPAGQPPRAVSLKFSENVQIPDNAIRVIAAGGGPVDVGKPAHGTNDSVVAVRLPKLANGTYVVSWRVVSADAHVVSGALSFAVGPSQGALITGIPSGPGPNRVVGLVFGLDRTAAFFGVLVLIGSVLFRRTMWPAGIDNRGVDRLSAVAWTLAFVTSLAGICLQGIAGGGVGLGSFFDTSLISNVLETDYGHALVARALLLVALAPILLLLRRRRLLAVDAALALVGLGLVVTFLYAGHAHTGRWVGLALVTDALHVGAAAVWFGGLCALAVTFTNAKVVDARFALSRYVLVAAPAIALVALSGIVQSLRQVGNASALFDTNYGRLLMVKVAIVIAILIAANTSRRVAGNRFRSVAETLPANRNARRKALSADRSALSALRKAVSVEVGFAVVVLAVTAALTNTQPARDVPSGKPWAGAPFSEVLNASPLTLAVSVVPGHTGTNRVTLTPRSSGNRLARVVDVGGSISQPGAGIAKLSITFKRQANGSYIGSIDIPLPGIWQFELSVLRNQFDESRATADLPVGVAATGGANPTPATSGLSATGVARVVRPYGDKLLAALARDSQICPPLTAARVSECRALLDEMDATAVSLSRKLRASSPQFSIESTMYFTVDAADDFAAGIQSYRATGCAAPQSKFPTSTCRRHAKLYRDPANGLEQNLRGWDQYLKP